MACEMMHFADNVARKLAPHHLDRSAERMHLLLRSLCSQAEALAVGAGSAGQGSMSHASLPVPEAMVQECARHMELIADAGHLPLARAPVGTGEATEHLRPGMRE